MSIQIGDKIPAVTLKKFGTDGMEEIHFSDYISGKKAIVFAVPGAFTPSCHEQHLPGYIQNADDLKAQGIDEIICVAVNDPFVMKSWGEDSGAGDKITMMPDGNGDLTRALGMEFDGSGHGLGERSKRYSMVVNDGTVESLEVEDSPGEVSVSAADACLVQLQSAV